MLRRTHELSLAAEYRLDHGAGLIHAQTDAEREHQGKLGQGAPSRMRRGAAHARDLAFGGDVERGDAEGGAEKERQIDHQHFAQAMRGAEHQIGQKQQGQ